MALCLPCRSGHSQVGFIHPGCSGEGAALCLCSCKAPSWLPLAPGPIQELQGILFELKKNLQRIIGCVLNDGAALRSAFGVICKDVNKRGNHRREAVSQQSSLTWDVAEQWQHPKNPITHTQTMYQINCEIFGEFLEKKCENAFPYSGFRILKEGVEMLESSQSFAVEEELPCQRLSAAWGSSCGRTFHLNLSESSSIRPGLISYFFPACGNSSGSFVLQNVWAASFEVKPWALFIWF